MDRLDLQVVIVFVGVSKIFVHVRRVRDVCMGVAELHACVATPCEQAAIVKVWFPECALFGGKNTWQKRFGTKRSVRCSEFRGGRFSEIANVYVTTRFAT